MSIIINTTFALLVLGVGVSMASNSYSSYQNQVYCTPSSEIQEPLSVPDLHRIVREGISSGKTLKAIGSRHSVTDVICTEGVPISMKGISYAKINEEDETVTVGAGIELMDAMEFLEKNGRTLVHVPAYGGITIGGAIGTGAHGSSLVHTASITDQVVGVTVIDGLGNMRSITDSEELRAFRVHLGLLGILVDVTLKTVPSFKMRVENKLESDSVMFGEGSKTLLEEAREHDWFQFFWFPTYKEIVTSRGKYVDVEEKGSARTQFIADMNPTLATGLGMAFETLEATRFTLGQKLVENAVKTSLHSGVIGREPIYTEDGATLSNPATGYAWRLQSNRCENCSWTHGPDSMIPLEVSIMFDLSQFSGVMEMMRDILERHPVSFYITGILIRFVKGSDALMAGASGQQDSFAIDWILPMRKDPQSNSNTGIGAMQAMLQSMVETYGGRPHWGKNGLHYTTQQVLNKTRTTEEKDIFISYMQKFDPNGVFLNKFGRRLLGVSDELDMHPDVTKCAIQDFCVCKMDLDCGGNQICGNIDGFNVCMDKTRWDFSPSVIQTLKNLSSQILALVATLAISYTLVTRRMKQCSS